MDTQPTWQPLGLQDLGDVNKIADTFHTELPERPEVFENKFLLYPSGCRKFVADRKSVGYGVAHPWILFSIPPLDTIFSALPPNPDCIYVHDVVVSPEFRGYGAARTYIDYIKRLGHQMGITSLALVSVYGTDVLWSRFGFQVFENSELDQKLLSYGNSARYMKCEFI